MITFYFFDPGVFYGRKPKGSEVIQDETEVIQDETEVIPKWSKVILSENQKQIFKG